MIKWKIEIFISCLVILFNYYVYRIIISNEVLLTPEIASLRDELWLLVFLFIYKLISNTNFTYQYNREKYIRSKFHDFYKKYHSTIKEVTNEKYIWPIVYAIMIIENFNRPPMVRLLEYVLFFFNRAKTLGIMQVKNKKRINDIESVRQGTAIIRNLYYSFPEPKYQNYWALINYIVQGYNPGSTYYSEVLSISEEIAKIMGINMDDYS